MRHTAKALTAAAALVLALTGCAGGPAASETPATPGALRAVNIGAVPTVDIAVLYLGEKQGFFEDQGLELDIEFGAGGAALIPALINGQYDIIYSNIISALQGVERGLPLVVTAPAGVASGDVEADTAAIIVPDDSAIQSPKDLEGKTVAVNTLSNLHEIMVREVVIKDGGDPDAVQFVELGLPDMGAALDSGQIDAMSTSEPWVGTWMQAGDDRIIALNPSEADVDFIHSVYLTTQEKAQADPGLIEAWRAALEESFAYAMDHVDEVKAEMANFSDVDPGILQQMAMSRYTVDFSRDDVLRVAEMTQRAHVLQDPEKATDLLIDGAAG